MLGLKLIHVPGGRLNIMGVNMVDNSWDVYFYVAYKKDNKKKIWHPIIPLIFECVYVCFFVDQIITQLAGLCKNCVHNSWNVL